ncbi:unnamed protein product, partial [Didymodactylos carnosus]
VYTDTLKEEFPHIQFFNDLPTLHQFIGINQNHLIKLFLSSDFNTNELFSQLHSQLQSIYIYCCCIRKVEDLTAWKRNNQYLRVREIFRQDELKYWLSIVSLKYRYHKNIFSKEYEYYSNMVQKYLDDSSFNNNLNVRQATS